MTHPKPPAGSGGELPPREFDAPMAAMLADERGALAQLAELRAIPARLEALRAPLADVAAGHPRGRRVAPKLGRALRASSAAVASMWPRLEALGADMPAAWVPARLVEASNDVQLAQHTAAEATACAWTLDMRGPCAAYEEAVTLQFELEAIAATLQAANAVLRAYLIIVYPRGE